MVTTTSYASWLPGDLRGYVENGIILPGDPKRLEQYVRTDHHTVWFPSVSPGRWPG